MPDPSPHLCFTPTPAFHTPPPFAQSALAPQPSASARPRAAASRCRAARHPHPQPSHLRTRTLRRRDSWLRAAPSLFEDTAPSPTPALLEARRASVHSKAQPWQSGNLARRQRARLYPPSKRRRSCFQTRYQAPTSGLSMARRRLTTTRRRGRSPSRRAPARRCRWAPRSSWPSNYLTN